MFLKDTFTPSEIFKSDHFEHFWDIQTPTVGFVSHWGSSQFHLRIKVLKKSKCGTNFNYTLKGTVRFFSGGGTEDGENPNSFSIQSVHLSKIANTSKVL